MASASSIAKWLIHNEYLFHPNSYDGTGFAVEFSGYDGQRVELSVQTCPIIAAGYFAETAVLLEGCIEECPALGYSVAQRFDTKEALFAHISWFATKIKLVKVEKFN